ncbi:hypothetical protein OQA88_12269 [Cercophora sp. LCS_1]
MTLLGPLTTTFTAPSSCSTTTPQIYQIWSGTESRYEQGPLFTSGSNCFPSGYNPAPNNYYSPGFCPHGYTAACTSLDSQTKSATETALVCCPTALSYTCADAGASLGCTTTLKNALAVVGVTVVTNGVISGSTTVSESTGGFAAHSIQVRFDQAATTTPGVLPAATPPILTIPPDLLPAETNPPAPEPRSGISTGAAIGIGVGSALGALIIASAVGFFFFLRWRRKRAHAPPDVSPNVPPAPPPAPPPKDPGLRSSTYTTTTTNAFTTTPLYELSDDISTLRHGQHITERGATTKRELTVTTRGGRSRVGSIGTLRTMRTGRTDFTVESELEGTPVPAHMFHPKAAELEAPGDFLNVSSGRTSRVTPSVGERDRSRDRGSTPGSESSNTWSIMRKEGVVATPWL